MFGRERPTKLPDVVRKLPGFDRLEIPTCSILTDDKCKEPRLPWYYSSSLNDERQFIETTIYRTIPAKSAKLAGRLSSALKSSSREYDNALSDVRQDIHLTRWC